MFDRNLAVSVVVAFNQDDKQHGQACCGGAVLCGQRTIQQRGERKNCRWLRQRLLIGQHCLNIFVTFVASSAVTACCTGSWNTAVSSA